MIAFIVGLIFLIVGLGALAFWFRGRARIDKAEAERQRLAEARKQEESDFKRNNSGIYRSLNYSYDDGSSRVASAKFAKRIAGIIAVITLPMSLIFGVMSMIYTQGVGEAKVFVDVSGKIVGTDLDAGWGTKAPWWSSVDYDLFAQEALYAGGHDGPPSYSGGTVNGKEVTVAVGGIAGGSTQGFVDVSVVYSLAPDEVEALYREYRTQERFTKSVVERTILAIMRQVPADYNAIEFRGTQRQDAADRMTEMMADRLGKYGIEDILVNIQDVRYPEQVEAALKEVEVAAQAVQKAEAKQRQAEVDAETRRIEAQGVADANAILNQSLTPEVLQQKYIDALKEGTVYVVPDGSTPFIGTK